MLKTLRSLFRRTKTTKTEPSPQAAEAPPPSKPPVEESPPATLPAAEQPPAAAPTVEKPAPRPRKPALLDRWGEGNIFEKPETADVKGKIRVLSGTGNLLRLGEDTVLNGSVVVTGSNNRIVLGKNVTYRGDILINGSDQSVTIGDFSTSQGLYILCAEGVNVTIGRSCMFSRSIEVRTTDAHSVIDRQTGERLNLAADVVIGDHVWVGLGCIINKGARVPTDSIVGAMSFVNGTFEEEGVVIAGTPAKIVRRGVTWHRLQKAQFSQAQMNRWRDR